MVYVDVFVAGVGKWYEFKCEETALIRDIIKEIYDVIRDKESIICEKQIDLVYTAASLLPFFHPYQLR